MRVEIATLLLAAGLSLAACDGGDKGKPPTPQASAGGAPAAAAPAAASAAPINAIDRSHAGTAAPAISFEKRGGDKVSLADFRGKRVLVNLWATWCAPCVAEMPDIDKMAAARPALTVLPLSQDMEGWQVVDKFFAPGKFEAIEPWLDQPGAFAEAIGARGLPMSVLYDEQGKEVWRVAGTLKWDSAEVAAAL